MKKILSAVLSAVMIFSAVSVPAFASGSKTALKGETYSGNPNSFKLNNVLVSELPQSGAQFYSALPSKFDSRSSSYLTSVKNQGDYGNCWSHSAMACAETYAVKSLGMSASTDFSEMQNAYFTYSTAYDKYGNLQGDSTKIVAPGFNYATIGGNIYMNTISQAKWQGVVYDSLCPQDTKNYTAPAYSSDYAYSKDILHLTNAQWLNMADINAVKALIMEYGIGSTAYFSDDPYYDDSLTNYYKDEYSINQSSTNHAVTLVGWDDNYSASNFTGAAKPKSNGAWILKNSWGTDVGENGYFYISYEDVSIKEAPVAFYTYAKANSYENIYEYDGASGTSTIFYSSTKTAYEANVFTAEDNSNLESVSYFSWSNGEKYTVNIYTGVSDTPTSGTLVATVDGTSTYSGYHTIKLNNLIAVSEGQKFSVVVKHTTTDGSEVTFLEDTSYNDGYLEYKSSAQSGQSFVSVNGTSWDDRSTQGENMRIKAFTTHNHDYTSETKQATCTEDGKITKTCKICGHTEVTAIPKLGHNFSSSSVTKAPTCSQSGIKTFYCSRCSTTKTETIPPTGDHDFTTETKQPTCTADGRITHTCKKCAYTYYETIPKLGHDYKLTVVTPTCEEGGYTVYTCSRGDSTYKDNYTEKLDHSLTFVETKTEPTCTESGVDIYNCSRCGKDFEKETKALGHSYSSTYKTVKTATFASAGERRYYCTRCKTAYKSVKYYSYAPKISYSSISSSSFKLSWGAVSTAKKYVIYQYNPSTKKYTTIATTTARSYTIKKKSAGTNYYYLVRAMRVEKGKWVKSAFATSLHVYKTTTLCSAPSFSFSSRTSSAFKISWKAIKGAKSYTVYQYNTSTKKYSKVKSLTGTSLTISSKSAGSKYYYLVRAFNERGAGSSYTVKSVKSVITCPSTPKASVSRISGGITVKWSKPKTATKFRVYVLDENAKIINYKDTTALKQNVYKLTKGKKYKILVRAYSSSGWSSYSSANYTSITY